MGRKSRYTSLYRLEGNGSFCKEAEVRKALLQERIYTTFNEEEAAKAIKEHRKSLVIRHFSVHNLRHTFCTRFCENETNIKIIQDIMGHSDISTTMNIYAEATENNGSAMRVSATGWLYPTIERTREVAKATAAVTHNHPEGIKGAVATASCIFLARNGATKDEIRPYYHHVESCQQTVPEAITAFLEAEDFEDAGE